MWPFRKQGGDAATIRRLRVELDDQVQATLSWQQHANKADAAMREMQTALTDDGVAAIARAVTARVADVYAAGGRSVEDRDVAVHAIVAEAVRKAARGEKHWNEAALARKAQGGPR